MSAETPGKLNTSQSLHQVLAEAAVLLRPRVGAECRREARLLMASTLGERAEAVFAADDRALTQAELFTFGQRLARRMSGQPMAQILGEKEFFGRNFIVSSHVLTPRPESELLVEHANLLVQRDASITRVLDLGTGTGCLLLSVLAENNRLVGVGVDRSLTALAVAARNRKRLGLDGRALFVAGDWGQALHGSFDLVLGNPPYIEAGEIAALMPEVSTFEPLLALDGGEDGLTAYRQIAPELHRLARPGAPVLLECGASQAMAVAAILKAESLEILSVHADLAGHERLVLARTSAK